MESCKRNEDIYEIATRLHKLVAIRERHGLVTDDLLDSINEILADASPSPSETAPGLFAPQPPQ